MFEGFISQRIKTSGAEIALVRGGQGAPLLLVHGYPQSHVMWHKVAPRLAQRFTVVVPDLRGYGASSKPPGDDEHLTYSKRAMANDLVEVMAALGFQQFNIAGHDRGARVTYRLALDHPERVRRAAVLDIIPTLEQFERMNRMSARAAYHWYFLAQPPPFP
jgi:haloacetate dehalogenase